MNSVPALAWCAFLCSALGYGMGCINPSYLIARARGFDIRQKGSGNAGASNAVITMGAGVGVASALFDIFKAFAAVQLAGAFFPTLTCAREIAGTACILGHIFPFYMHFRGGKGLASVAGVILATDWRVFLVILTLAVVAVLVIDYLFVVPVGVALLFPWVHAIMTGEYIGALVLCAASVAIIWRHRVNFRRVRTGTELRFSYLWRKEKELERIRSNVHYDGSAHLPEELEVPEEEHKSSLGS